MYVFPSTIGSPNVPRASIRNLAPYCDSVLPHGDRMESFGISVPATGDAQLFFLPVLYKFARQTMGTMVKVNSSIRHCASIECEELINNGPKTPFTTRGREGLPRPFSQGACERGGVEQNARGT